jgi:hypothetical protein
VGWTLFVSGFFVLAAAGANHASAVLVLVLGGAALVSLPIGPLTLGVEASEAPVRRAWASGLRRLAGEERRWDATAARGARYAGVLWAANGLALWLATILGRI